MNSRISSSPESRDAHRRHHRRHLLRRHLEPHHAEDEPELGDVEAASRRCRGRGSAARADALALGASRAPPPARAPPPPPRRRCPVALGDLAAPSAPVRPRRRVVRRVQRRERVDARLHPRSEARPLASRPRRSSGGASAPTRRSGGVFVGDATRAEPSAEGRSPLRAARAARRRRPRPPPRAAAAAPPPRRERAAARAAAAAAAAPPPRATAAARALLLLLSPAASAINARGGRAPTDGHATGAQVETRRPDDARETSFRAFEKAAPAGHVRYGSAPASARPRGS